MPSPPLWLLADGVLAARLSLLSSSVAALRHPQAAAEQTFKAMQFRVEAEQKAKEKQVDIRSRTASAAASKIAREQLFRVKTAEEKAAEEKKKAPLKAKAAEVAAKNSDAIQGWGRGDDNEIADREVRAKAMEEAKAQKTKDAAAREEAKKQAEMEATKQVEAINAIRYGEAKEQLESQVEEDKVEVK